MNGKLQHWVIKIVDQSDRLIVFDPKPSSGRSAETSSNGKKSKNFLVRKLIQKKCTDKYGQFKYEINNSKASNLSTENRL